MKKKQRSKANRAEEADIDARFARVVEAFAEVRGVNPGKLFTSSGLKG